MTPTILGLDIGGANLKAATNTGRAVSVAFALWKQPEKLAHALGELIAQFPNAEELAVTMTGELCDCFETKRAGVRHIVTAVMNVSRSRPIRVWSTDGVFRNVAEAEEQYLKVAAANWHALATFAGPRYAPAHGGLLLDIGSTTSDVIPMRDGVPSTSGLTDTDRMQSKELVYTGVKRTPVCAILADKVAAELFATTQDVYVLRGDIPEDPADHDTADGRSRTRANSRTRLARMLGGDDETVPEQQVHDLAAAIHHRQLEVLTHAARAAFHGRPSPPELQTIIVSGSGEFLARQVAEDLRGDSVAEIVSLNQHLGPELSTAAPAYAVAMLAAEQP